MSTPQFPMAINAGVVINHPTMKLFMNAEFHALVITISIVVDAMELPVSIQSLPKRGMDVLIIAKKVSMDPTKSTLFKLKILITDISKVGSRLNVRHTTASYTTSNILIYHFLIIFVIVTVGCG